MMWSISHRFDPPSVALADRHYSRRKPGTPQFVPPGRNLVLLGPNALWVTSWPFPEYVRHRWPGAWVCSLFRNEGLARSSDLIIEACAATRWRYGAPPPLGMVTFIDRSKVRRKRDWGRCFRKAEFRPDGDTQGGLFALRLAPEAFPEPSAPKGAQLGFTL